MNIDTGLAVVILAVLIFYMRLIILQRQRAKQMARPADTGGKKNKKSENQPKQNLRNFSILSTHGYDRLIAGVGAVAILFGVLLYARILPFPVLQSYWWIPTASGIVAFSWAFKL